jgi:3-isopropylmalate dehydratase small subunit
VVLEETHCRAIAAAGEARIDVDDQTVVYSGGVVEYELEEEVKHRLLHGLDDIAATLSSEEAITAFEASGSATRGPVTTAL